MNWLIGFRSGVKALFNRQRASAEVDEEIAGYIEAETAHKQSLGMTPEGARRAALVAVGSSSAVKQQVWDSRWETAVENLFQDLRLSIRKLVKSPGFTSIALLSVALGIGANNAIFTLLDQLLLRDLPVKDPQQLVTFGNSESAGVAGGLDLGQFGYYPWYFACQLEANPGPFQGIAAFGSFSYKASIRLPASEGASEGAKSALVAPVNVVSGNYFRVLGVRPFLGRGIVASDAATPGSGAVVVLSYDFWSRSFSSDPTVVGKTIIVNRVPFSVVGVMPKSFQGIKLELEPTAMWAPVTMQRAIFQQPSFLAPHSGPYFLHLFGRLSPSAATNRSGFLQAQTWLNYQIHAGIRDADGTTGNLAREQEINREFVPLIPASHGVSLVRAQYAESLRILMAVVVLILLIACANLANLLLTRAAAAQREIATRLALGSSRFRIIRQNLLETMLLSFAGGLLGLGIALLATRAFISFISAGTFTIALSSRPNMAVLLFTLATCLATSLICGLAPAFSASRAGDTLTLSVNTRTAQGTGGRSSRFWPKALVTAQVTLSFVLLVGSGFFLRTLRNLQNQDYGFERTNLVAADFDARLAGYKPSQTVALHQRLIDRLSRIPGVRSVALAATPPISPGGWSSTISPAGYTPAPKENMAANLDRVSGDYFETVGIPAIAGRTINGKDTADSGKVAVINQTVAKRYYPHDDAVGHWLTLGIDSVKGPWRIVGVVRDTKARDPRSTDPIRMVYIPLQQIDPFLPLPPPSHPGERAAAGQTAREENQDRYANVVLLRTTADPKRIAGELQSAVRDVDSNLPLLHVGTIQEQVSSMITHDELISTLTGIFSGLALLLAAIGLYGVMSHNVVRRRSEIGIRLAIGARAPDIRWMVLRESLVLLTIGICFGVPLAVGSTMLVKRQFFGVSPSNPEVFLAALAVVAAVTLLAAWLPARRASTLDPMAALRVN
ncbi:MAG TPA: ABC transporter permease [Bryobacteraceae bacterium]|nr:ABC transporter permease [Bryobacteraceae bacterium]